VENGIGHRVHRGNRGDRGDRGNRGNRVHRVHRGNRVIKTGRISPRGWDRHLAQHLSIVSPQRRDFASLNI